MNVPAAALLSPQEIARRSGSNFLVSFALLERSRRKAFTAVYAFCRVVDDAVDEASSVEEGRAHLEFWRHELASTYGGQPKTTVGQELQDAVTRFGIVERHLLDVLDGMAMDLQAPRFPDLAALEAYCYRVASAVGLACLPVLGAQGPAAERYAERLGLALQLTNILRDLRSDARQGRIYAPRDMLAAAGVEPAWLAGEGPAAAYAAGGAVERLVLALAAVAEQRFAEAAAALPHDQRKALLPPRLMDAVYRELLRLVRRRGGDLRHARRLSVPAWRKLLLALRVRRRDRS